MQCHRRKIGYSHFSYQALVHIHFLHDPRLSFDHLYDTGFLAQHEAVYIDDKKESAQMVIAAIILFLTKIKASVFPPRKS